MQRPPKARDGPGENKMVTLDAHIINLGKYNEGILMETLLSFPTTKEDVQKALKRIGVDGVRYQEVILTEHDSNLNGFCHCITQYDSIDEVNYLVHLLSELSPDELVTFQAVLNYGEHDQSAHDLINLALNLEHYEFHPDVDTDTELGHIYADDMEALEVPEKVRPYFDYEAYGRDVRLNDGGCFVDGGYMTKSPTPFEERYHGPEDIPPEHRVFAYPTLSIREKLAACGERLTRSGPEKPTPSQGREER